MDKKPDQSLIDGILKSHSPSCPKLNINIPILKHGINNKFKLTVRLVLVPGCWLLVTCYWLLVKTKKNCLNFSQLSVTRHQRPVASSPLRGNVT